MGTGGLEIEFQSRGRFVGRKGGEGGKKWNNDAGWWGDVWEFGGMCLRERESKCVGGWVDTSCALGLLRFDFLEGRRERALWMISSLRESARQTDRSWLKYERQAILVLAPGRG
jgi:hypothetical protein